jgi:ribokinase
VRPGETIASSGFDRKTGGKGSNQAYAAARAGGRVVLDAQIGSDGLAVRDRIAAGGVDVSRVRVVEDEVSHGFFGGPCPCGMAAARHTCVEKHMHER